MISHRCTFSSCCRFLIILLRFVWLLFLCITNNRNIISNALHLILETLDLVQEALDLILLLVHKLSQDVELSRLPGATEISNRFLVGHGGVSKSSTHGHMLRMEDLGVQMNVTAVVAVIL